MKSGKIKTKTMTCLINLSFLSKKKVNITNNFLHFLLTKFNTHFTFMLLKTGLSNTTDLFGCLKLVCLLRI